MDNTPRRLNARELHILITELANSHNCIAVCRKDEDGIRQYSFEGNPKNIDALEKEMGEKFEEFPLH